MTASFFNPFPEKRAFQSSLLRWYSLHKRDLPWRKTADPYKIMVSEFMLQQTRIETVLPYYGRFLKAFPSLLRLARAPLQKVLKFWAGMGYYARARNLHAAARIIRRDLSGKIPATKEALLTLPGFGPYTAGAVASIAFNQRTAAPDGNVKRVLSRLVNAPASAPSLERKRQLEFYLEDLIPERQASGFNQALMDLGAMVCLPVRPKCHLCPVRRFCPFTTEEKKKGIPPERRRREEIWAIALIENKGRFLIHRQEGKGLLGGLWQFPTLVSSPETGLGPADDSLPAKRTLRKYLRDRFGITTRFRNPLSPLRHEFTHIRATLCPYLFSLAPGKSVAKTIPALETRWVKISGLSRYPISRAMTKVADLLNAERR